MLLTGSFSELLVASVINSVWSNFIAHVETNLNIEAEKSGKKRLLRFLCLNIMIILIVHAIKHLKNYNIKLDHAEIVSKSIFSLTPAGT